jgi:hypothetical protein
MKRSLSLSAIILVLGGVPVLMQEKRLSSLREEQRSLREEAAGLGIEPAFPSQKDADRSTKRERGDLAKQAARVGDSLIGFARELEAMAESGTDPDAAFQQRSMEVMQGLADLDGKQLKEVIERLKNEPGLSGKSRGDIISYAILAVADRKPEVAVSLYVESADLLDQSVLGSHVISSALGRWAAASPNEALEWISKNESKHADIIDEDTRRSILSGIAVNDPGLAFSLLDEIGFVNRTMAIHAVLVTGSHDPQQRTGTLEALRGYLAKITDPATREETGAKALELLARSIDREGYEPLVEWMNQAKFSPQEKQQFAGGLTYFTTKEDTGKWVEWMATNLPEEHVAAPVRDLVAEWTDQDYQSAGNWLGTLANGPARYAAVEAYAGTVAAYDPKVAEQWAMTLPAGPARDATLEAVHQNWPDTDPDGAAAFAAEHGIEE